MLGSVPMVNLRCCLKHWLNRLHGLLTAGRGIHTNGRKSGPMILVSGSFIATTIGTEKAVSCPASKEMDYKSNCAKCGLCSGLLGKGTKDVKILQH